MSVLGAFVFLLFNVWQDSCIVSNNNVRNVLPLTFPYYLAKM